MNQQQMPTSPAEAFDEKSATGKAATALFDSVELIVFTVVAVFLMLTFALRVCEVSGPSMEKSFFNGEKLLVSNLFYEPEVGDVIVFHQTSDLSDTFNEPIIKRVIATGGQYVKIDYTADKVYVSNDVQFTEDEVLDESAYIYLSNGIWKEYGSAPEVFAVPEGYLFVMGDNRNVSADSRSVYVDLVDERRVLGKALLRVAPFSKFGKVE